MLVVITGLELGACDLHMFHSSGCHHYPPPTSPAAAECRMI